MKTWALTFGLSLVAGFAIAAAPFSSYTPSSSESGTQTFTAGDRTYNGDLAVNGNLSAAKLTTPTNGTLTAGTGGSLSDSTTYYYRVAATTATGTTLASTETSLATGAVDGGAHGTITVTWAQITGATGYKVYCRTTGAEQLCATITSGSTLSWVDTGSVSPSGVLPSADTTGSESVGNVLTVDNGTVKEVLRQLTSGLGYSCLYMLPTATAPSASNYTLAVDGTTAYFNAPSSAEIQLGGSTKIAATSTGGTLTGTLLLTVGARFTAVTLSTCGASTVTLESNDATGGTGGKQTKRCQCILKNDGTTYAWRNPVNTVASGHRYGNTTTCPDVDE